jgi:nicotinamide mononucleotide transporter
MQPFVSTLATQAHAMSAIEAVAVLLAIGYVALAIRQNIWCWMCAGISTAIFAYLFFGVQLYMEAILNVYYFLMAIYGWHTWRFGNRQDCDLPVVTWPRTTHAAAIAAIVLLSLASGYALETRTDAAFPYADSLTTWAAVWATFLVARKVLENWWYWLAIDATMIYVFWAKELELTAVLYIAYLILIPFGLINWTRSYREASA